MSSESDLTVATTDEAGWRDAMRWAGAFIASFKSSETRRAYQRDLHCWFGFCAVHRLHPFADIRRTHIELYLRQLERQVTPPSNATMYRRVATLSSWFAWLEDEEVSAGNPAARVRRPRRHDAPQPWCNRNELTDLLAAGEDEGGHPYALVCLLGLNGLRVSEACSVDVTAVGGSRYQPTLFVVGKGDKPAEIVLNPRTQQAVDAVIAARTHGPLLLNEWGNHMAPHNATAIVRRLAARAGITHRVTPHALRRSYITVGLLQGVPLREMKRAARHVKADTTVSYDQSDRSFHRDPTFVLMAATAR